MRDRENGYQSDTHTTTGEIRKTNIHCQTGSQQSSDTHCFFFLSEHQRLGQITNDKTQQISI